MSLQKSGKAYKDLRSKKTSKILVIKKRKHVNNM